MFDQSKVEATRTAIRELATEYEFHAVPDVARTLRQIADLAPESLIRLGQLMQAGVK